jgi:hypothetical protein
MCNVQLLRSGRMATRTRVVRWAMISTDYFDHLLAEPPDCDHPDPGASFRYVAANGGTVSQLGNSFSYEGLQRVSGGLASATFWALKEC